MLNKVNLLVASNRTH